MTSLPPWGDTAVVGGRVSRIDGAERVSGTARFTVDVILPDMLHAAILRCPHAHARVRRVDASRARRCPGVHAVLTPDSPGADIAWYGGREDARSRLLDPHCRYEGEEVAAVAAETIEQAREALEAIDVDFEPLPFVRDAAQALRPDAPRLHDGGAGSRAPSVYERGDVARGFAEADVVVEQTYTTPCEIHVPLERHGSVARWEGARLTVWDSTQGVFGRQEDLARVFGLPLSDVRVVCPYVGGGFGSKLDTPASTPSSPPSSRARPAGRCASCSRARRRSSAWAIARPTRSRSRRGRRRTGR
jgi:xanthine dehydrogenase YagR molybdenum-binding subunit